jgi:hypothetical protein
VIHTCLAKLAYVRPRIAAHTFEATPKLPTLGAIFAGRWHTRRLAVFDNLRQMDGHVAVDVENLAVDDKAAEAANQALFHCWLFEHFPEGGIKY